MPRLKDRQVHFSYLYGKGKVKDIVCFIELARTIIIVLDHNCLFENKFDLDIFYKFNDYKQCSFQKDWRIHQRVNIATFKSRVSTRKEMSKIHFSNCLGCMNL
jgi:hypothetical protein